MDKVKLSAILVTRNESKKIRRCLDSIKWIDEIVIVDQSSQDSTVEICKEFTDKVYVVSNKGFCEPDRPTALAKTSNDWVLYLDADEEVTPELQKETIRVLEQKPIYNSYYIPRKNIFLGKWIKGSGWYPGYVLRLFKKGSVGFSLNIHSDLTPINSFGYLQEPLNHYTCENLEEYLNKLNRYTGILAMQAYEKGKRVNSLNIILKLGFLPFAYGLKKLILQKGFKDGVIGFLIAFLTGLTVFLMNAKVWGMQKSVKDIS